MTVSFAPARMVMRALMAVLAASILAACDTTAGIGSGLTGSRSVNANQKVTVAMLVPLGSGQSELDFIGSSLVNAARLAQSDLSGIDMDLQIYATGGPRDTQRAAAEAQRAIAAGAQVIIGPLFSTHTAAIAPVAASRGVSVLSFSNSTAVAGNNVFLLGTTFENTANRVVSWSIGQGRRDIGVIHSNDVAGRAGVAATQSAVARFGGTFVGASGYDQTTAGISAGAPQAARAMRAAGANAVVLTDDAGVGLPFVAPMLGSAGLSGADTQLLGLTRWNEPAEATSILSLQGGVFAAPDPASVQRFEARYLSAYGQSPHNLAGLAYDGVAAVGAMIREARGGSGKALTRAQITDPSGFAGVSGIFRFREDGTNDRGLALFRLSGGRAVMLDRSPSSFGSAGF